ncbi:MAG: acyl carrier protein [Fibrobacterota bacterium]
MSADIEGKVKEIIIDKLGVNSNQVTNEASFTDDLGADSLDLADLVMAFEEEFDIEISDEDQGKITNVGAAVEFLKEKKS